MVSAGSDDGDSTEGEIVAERLAADAGIMAEPPFAHASSDIDAISDCEVE